MYRLNGVFLAVTIESKHAIAAVAVPDAVIMLSKAQRVVRPGSVARGVLGGLGTAWRAEGGELARYYASHTY
jgi:hypothetical protein